jgi:uncharacterized membrane protein
MPIISLWSLVLILTVLIVPGLALSFAIWPNRQLSVIERIAVAYGLSFIVLPLSVYGLMKVNIPLSPVSVWVVFSVLTVLGAGLGWWRHNRHQNIRNTAA